MDERTKERLLAYFPEGTTIYAVLRKRRNTSRDVDFYVIDENRPIYVSGYVAETLGFTRTAEGAVRIRGCGFDAATHVAHYLSRALYDGDAGKLRKEWL